MTTKTASRSKNSEKRQQKRRQDPEGTKRNILTVARHEFADIGLSGARVDTIADKTKTSKRMIYYYFGDKAGLYIAALEDSYAEMRAIENALNFDGLSPVVALKMLAVTAFNYHIKNPVHIRLVMIENVNRGRFVEQSKFIQTRNKSAVKKISGIYEAGCISGEFREDLKPIDIHWLISSMSFLLSLTNTRSTKFLSKIYLRIEKSIFETKLQKRCFAMYLNPKPF